MGLLFLGLAMLTHSNDTLLFGVGWLVLGAAYFAAFGVAGDDLSLVRTLGNEYAPRASARPMGRSLGCFADAHGQGNSIVYLLLCG
jgi:hypothetical protein